MRIKGFARRVQSRRRLFSRAPGGREYLAIGICVAAAATTLYVTTRPPSGLAAATSTPTAVTSVPTNVVQTRWGPLDDNDRLLLIKVRQAGLWEMPTGQQAQQRASSEKVKEVGRKIAAEHAELDADVRNTAGQLGVSLPSTPSSLQQGWMRELATKTGDDYDRDFVYRLRAAHGQVFSVIAMVRATTANSLIRDFAVRAMAFVNRHMTYLESTGLVDYSTLH